MEQRYVLLKVACGLAGLTAALLGSSPLSAEEAPQRLARLGFVHPQSPSTATRGVTEFWDRLRELGWVENQNLIIETRWADGRVNRLPALMDEVIQRRVDVIVTWSTPAAVAAKKATSTIPIVDSAMADPIRSGLVESLARPGGNLTGLSRTEDEGLAGKWLQLLQEVVPQLSSVAVIEDPNYPTTRNLVRGLGAVAPKLALKLHFIDVRKQGALGSAFVHAARKAQGVLVLPGVLLSEHRREVTSLAAKHGLPTIYHMRDYVDAGGLMAYGPDFGAQWRRAADYVDKILKGAKPSELPIEQPTQYLLVVNLRTAKALGLTIPESILLRADEVIR